jgi:hypothetical protein
MKCTEETSHWLSFKAGVTPSRNLHQMDTRIRKCSNSDLIVITSGHSWGHRLPSYDPRLNFSGSGSNFVSGRKIFGIPKTKKNARRHCEGSFSCWILMPILRFVRPSWSHLVKSCSLRLYFVWSSVQWPQEDITKETRRFPIVFRRVHDYVICPRNTVVSSSRWDHDENKQSKFEWKRCIFIMVDIKRYSLRPSSSSVSLAHLHRYIKSFHDLQLINNYFQFISWWWVNREKEGSSIANFYTP